MRRNLLIVLTAAALAASIPATASAAVKEGQASVVATVSFRTEPSTSSQVVRYLKPGENVSLLEKVNAYWWKVRESGGQIGYVSSSSKYIHLVSEPTEVADGASQGSVSVVATVSFREAPSTSGSRIRYLKPGETVELLEKTNDYWWKVRDASGQTGYVSSSSKYVELGSGAAQDPGSGASAGTNAVIHATVSLREAPSTSGTLIRYLRQGETVTVTSQYNSYWYAVIASDGQTGYVSSSSQYITLTGGIPASGGGNAGAGAGAGQGTADPSAQVEAVIAAGMKYLGTPYEFGSSRSTTTTFDCSDFVRQAFKDALGITLPADSRQQGAYVRDHSTVTTDWTKLKRGDLMFFMDYNGTKASDYASKDPFNTRISHVGIYLGDGQILHTYSNESGGVRVDSISDTHWEYRFLFGGSAL